MKQEDAKITYQGSQITIFSDERNDYINLTEMAIAHSKTRSTILNWIRSRQTIEFLTVWEKKYNPDFSVAQMSNVSKLIKSRTLSTKLWIELTNAKGIFTRLGNSAGTYAHKDIAVRFGGWLSPEFELFLVEEIQRLKKIEEQKHSFELLNHEQILFLVRLKEVFKFVAHQEIVENAHREVYAAKSKAKNPFLEFNNWRNKILDIKGDVIDERIRQFCIENKIPLTKKIINQPKREKILLLDSYQAVKHAVWDFLSIKGEVNALNLADLVGEMMRAEKGQVLRKNEETLFEKKQDLGQYNDFETKISEMQPVKTARQILAARNQKQLPDSKFNRELKGLLSVPKPKIEE